MTTICIFTAHCSLRSPFSFKEFFWHEPFLESLLDLLHHGFCFTFCLFGYEACGILAPWPGTKPTSPALEREVLTAGLPESPSLWSSLACLLTGFSRQPVVLWLNKHFYWTVKETAPLRGPVTSLVWTQRWSSVQSPRSRVRILQYFSPYFHGLMKREESQARKAVSMKTTPNGVWPWLWDVLRQVSLQAQPS